MSNPLKKIYDIDRSLRALKKKRSVLMDHIHENNITQEGKYALKITVYDRRQVVPSKFKRKVSEKNFLAASTIPVSNAQKYLSNNDLEKVVVYKPCTKEEVIMIDS